MDIAVIGGGIGGLATALYLHRAGIPCRVYEAVTEYRPLGVGINLFPHAVRRLTELGLADAMAARAVAAREFTFYNQHGQLIYKEPSGLLAGYDYPHYSFHRHDLHQVLYEAVCERMGAGAVVLGHKCSHVEQDGRGVTVHFRDAASGEPLPVVKADAAIACDGFHSAVRRQYHPDEGPAHFGGINLWRGVTRGKPFLSGASLTRCGPLKDGKLVVYPVRNHPDGTQTINWAAEVQQSTWSENDWNKQGRLEDFLHWFERRSFDWLDIPDLLRRAEFILEYPMVDRDPIARWTFGRVTLLGDAAHPMYPRGGNGGAQSILDAECIAAQLLALRDPERAFAAYEAERRPATTRIVLTNRSTPPDAIIETVEARSGGKPFARIEDVISQDEIRQMSEGYKQVTSWNVAAVNKAA